MIERRRGDPLYRRDIFWEWLCDNFRCDVRFTTREVHAKLTQDEFMKNILFQPTTKEVSMRCTIGGWLAALADMTNNLVHYMSPQHYYMLPSKVEDSDE